MVHGGSHDASSDTVTRGAQRLVLPKKFVDLVFARPLAVLVLHRRGVQVRVRLLVREDGARAMCLYAELRLLCKCCRCHSCSRKQTEALPLLEQAKPQAQAVETPPVPPRRPRRRWPRPQLGRRPP